jgi:crossover junction endodeoxyribonuclease RusA
MTEQLDEVAPIPTPVAPPVGGKTPAGDRVMLATIGVGVPASDAAMLVQAVAAEAGRLGYQSVVTEMDQVSGTRPDVYIRNRPPTSCPGCGRTIGRYPSGRFYDHHCRPVQRTWTLDLHYDGLRMSDFPLISENSRLHRMERAKRTTKLRSDAYYLAKQAKLPACEWVRVTLHWRPAKKNRRDGENPTPTLKALSDGLTDAALVIDDTKDRMEKRIEIHDPIPGQPTRYWLTVEAL